MIKTIKSIKSNYGMVFVVASADLSECFDIKADHGNKDHREMDTFEAFPLFLRLTHFICSPRITVYGKAFK